MNLAKGRRFGTFFLLLATVVVSPVPGYAADRPNVVLILADDIGFECLGCYGSREYSTPCLDRLAAGGIRFANCHATPLCTPSRVNLLSGKSNVFNYIDFGVYPRGDPTFANWFKQHGYVTTVAGKWQLLKPDAGISPAAAGFDTWCVWNTPLTKRARYWHPSLELNGKLMSLDADAYGPDVLAHFLVEFIHENKDQPFLIYYPMLLVHNPFLPTPDSANRHGRNAKKNFIDMVHYMDKCVQRVIDALETNGLRERTLIIFVGDNGTNAQLVSVLNGRRIRGGKGYTHDYGTHVPLIVNWPGRVPPHQVNRDLICFSDFLPTLIEAAGLPPMTVADSDGWSFWPQCLGKPGKKHEWIFTYYFPRPHAGRFDDKYRHWEVRWCRTVRYKLYGYGDFYDTAADVLEHHPLPSGKLAPKLRHTRTMLQKALDGYPKTGQRID